MSSTVNSFSDSHQSSFCRTFIWPRRTCSALLRRQKRRLPAINDLSGSISSSWGVNVTPSIVIIKDGKISSIATATSSIGLWLRTYFA
ncbi:hypothetical protein O9992_20415 [Vibrio lentus]|nr:hypothetical protein [Vibrio lentus]